MPNTLTNMLFAAALAVGATTTAQAGAAVFPDSRALGFGLPGEPHEALGRCMKVGQPCGGAIATTFGYHCCDGSVCDADETGTIGKCVIPVTKIRGRSPFDQKPVVGCLPAGASTAAATAAPATGTPRWAVVGCTGATKSALPYYRVHKKKMTKDNARDGRQLVPLLLYK